MAGKIETGGVKLVVENYDAFVRQMHTASGSMHRFGEAAQATSQQVEKTSQDFTGLGLAMTALGAAGKAIILGAGLQASRIEELGILLGVTRQNAVYLAEAEGDLAKAAALTSEAVQEQADGIRELHLSGEVANRVVADLIRYNLDWTRATELARLAQDAATFAMQDSSQAVLGLINGITTLQPRVLRTYGLMINLNVAYRKFAETTGVAVKDMTILQRQQAAYNEVLSQAPRIAGAYEAAMGTAAKQIRSFKTDIVNLAEAFGEEYTPALDAAVDVGRSFLHFLTDLPDPIQAFIVGAGGAGTALATMTGAAILLLPRLSALSAGFTILATAIGVSRIAMLGFVGAVPLVIGAIVALNATAKAHQEEAAAILDSTKTYADYTAAIEHAGLEVNELSEELYDMARAAKEVNEEFNALNFQRAVDELRSMEAETITFIQSMPTFTAETTSGAEALEIMKQQAKAALPAMSDLQLEILQNTNFAIEHARALGLEGDAMVEYVRFLQEAARAEEYWRLARAPIGDHEEKMLGVANAAKKVADATLLAAEATDLYLLTAGGLERASDAWGKLREIAEEGLLEVAEKSIEAEQKADDARWDARRKLIDSLNDLERKHARALEEIYKDIAQINIDLQNDILEAEREAAQERLELQRELARELEALARELAQDLADLERERLQDLADLDREYAQDREDALRDLNRDIADLERDLAKDLEEIRADYLQDLLELEKDYAKQREDLLNDFAQRAEDIEAKYSLEPEEPSIDELREALQAELRLLQEAREEQHGVMSAREKEILAELEALKAKELAQLEEEKQKQLDLLKKQQEEEKAARDEAYQKEVEEARAAYEERRRERERQYAEKLEDLRIARERERQEIEEDYKRRQADLQAKHQQERAEILRRHAEALVDLDTQLAEEKARLETAAQENRDRLAERLADEKQNYTDRQTELMIAWQRRMEEIDRQEKAEITELENKLAMKLLKYVEFHQDVDAATKEGMRQWIDNTFLPEMDRLVKGFIDRLVAMQRAAAALGFLGQSPAPWWKEMGESWVEGIEKGFDAAALSANVAAVMGDLQMQIQTSLPAQRASLPMGMGSTSVDRSTSNSLQVTAQYQQYQSEASLRDDLSLWNGMMRGWGR